MQKQKLNKCRKSKSNIVGVGALGDPHFKEITPYKITPPASKTGITLIALIITIIIMLILIGVTVTIALNGGLFKTAKNAAKNTQNEADRELALSEGKVTIGGKEYNSIEEYAEGGWTQDRITVTNGKVTLKVGQSVTGYTGNNVGDGDWYVLGAEEGKLLITTKTNQGSVSLGGQDGYTNGVETLNTEGAKYKDENMAESARSINVDDINRVTGYDPDVTKYNAGASKVNQWENEVTYKLNSNDNKIHYSGTKYPTSDASSSYSSFTYWTGTEWKTLESGESVKIKHDYYYYFPQTLNTTKSLETKIADIEDSTEAYDLLFANTGSSPYYLSSTSVYTDEAFCDFAMLFVYNGYMHGHSLYSSLGKGYRCSMGLRPVVSLKSTVTVSADGVLSI